MSRLFLSHSSENNVEAVALQQWLVGEGWNDVFLDVDPDRGITVGERWERALNEAASRCEAVLILVSKAWLGSRWCLKEFNLAHRLNKRLFGVLIEPIAIADLPADLTSTWQLVDLGSGQDHTIIRVTMPRTHEQAHVTFSREGLARLRNGLAKAGLDPRFFAWPPDNDQSRPPYRGLRPLEAEDAGIFFGRDAPIVEALDSLRGLREAAPPRLFVIIGASGAGKSSFLRAGLLPRLARDDRTFLALPVIRPEQAPISGETGLVRALETALAAHGLAQSRVSIRNAVAAGAEVLRPLLEQLVGKAFGAMLVDASAARRPALVLAVDQAEELFVGEGAPEGEALLALVRDLVRQDSPDVIALFTIRSDAYDRLETAKALEGLRQQALPLLPMPRGAYQTVIEGPAARLKTTSRPLAIEPRLTQRLLEDIEKGGGSDALPLLAFTLEQLYIDYGGDGALRLADYEAFGGIKGAIEAAVERALAAAARDPRIPRDRAAQLALLRRGLIPWLAGIDPESGSPRRRIARLADIPGEAEPLVRLLVEQRLLSTDRIMVREGDKERVEITIEPAHEALLRQWGLLHGWLEEDFAALTTLEAVKRAARDWEANERQEDWLNHGGSRLDEAEKIAQRSDLAGALTTVARDYLRKCRERDEAEERARLERIETERRLKEGELERERLARQAAEQAQELAAERARTADEARKAAEEKARSARRLTYIGFAAAVLLDLGAWAFWWIGTLADQRRIVAEANLSIANSQSYLRDGNVAAAVRSAYHAFATLPSDTSRSALLTALMEVSPHLIETFELAGRSAQAVAWTDDDTVALALDSGTLRYLDIKDAAATGNIRSVTHTVAPWQDNSEFVRALRRTAAGALIAVFSNGTFGILDAGGGGADLYVPATPATIDPGAHAAAIGRSGSYVVMATVEDGVKLFNCNWRPGVKAGEACSERRLGGERARAVEISPDEQHVAVGDVGGTVSIYKVAGETAERSFPVGDSIVSLGWAPDRDWLAVGTTNGKVVVIDLVAMREIGAPIQSDSIVTTLGWSAKRPDLGFVCEGVSICLWRFQPNDRNDHDSHPIGRLTGHANRVTRMAWAPDGRRLATIAGDGTMRLWSLDQNTDASFALPPCKAAGFTTAAIALDGSRIAAGGQGGMICLWDAGGQPVRALGWPTGSEVTSLAWNGSDLLAAGYEEGSVATWSMDRGNPVSSVALPTDTLSRVAWTAGGRMIAAPLRDGRIALVDPAQPADIELAYLERIGGEAVPWGLATHPDGKTLFVSYISGPIGIWDVQAKRQLGAIPSLPSASGERLGAASLAVSPDGRRLATSGSGRSVPIYDIERRTGQSLAIESSETNTVAFSPDGRRLAALGADNRIYVWTMNDAAPSRWVAIRAIPTRAAVRDDSRGPEHANWLAWTGNDAVAVATSSGQVHVIGLDETGWLRRLRGLDERPAGQPK